MSARTSIITASVTEQSILWDVVVIGGGPAGMMSAAVAGSRGLKVLLLEKNSILGKKLRITGGGRCNITNATFENRTLLANYTNAEQFLFSAFTQFSVQETLDFFQSLNLPTKVEAVNRVFPTSEKAEDVANTLVDFVFQNGVTIKTGVTVTSLHSEDHLITRIESTIGTIKTKSCIVATGGTSRPDTGSTGDGYEWLRKLGHEVTKPLPSLVPITLKEPFIQKLAGLTIDDAVISLYQDALLVKKTVGKLLFTHNGLSGPGILNISTLIGDTLEHGPVVLKINTVARYNEEELLQTLKDACILYANKKVKNILSEILPTSLIPVILELSNLDSDRTCNTITRNERHLLIQNMRGLSVTVKGLLGPEKAIIASGGVAITEVDFRTMQSRLYKNLYIVGDLLDIKRPSGGYSLQLCWSTGYVAGQHCGVKETIPTS